MKHRNAYILIITAVLSVIAPFAGIFIAGFEMEKYIEFPPSTVYIRHYYFSPIAFCALAIVLCLIVLPFLLNICKSNHLIFHRQRNKFPKWGLIGLLLLAISWVIAWTRLDLFAPIQHHSFVALWLGYIIVLNAFCLTINGSSPLSKYPKSYLLLFPLSALFWWLFEILNRFVQNWTYLNVSHFSPLEYFIFATLSFSTVLPAVYVTAVFLEGVLQFKLPKTKFLKMTFMKSKNSACVAFTLSLGTLFCVGLYPNILFPMLWLAPLCLLESLAVLFGKNSLLTAASEGEWKHILLWCMAGLFCGFFWEMWNIYSLAKWIYHIPLVGKFHLFELPILGYAGYLPFGLLCGEVIMLIKSGTNETAH